MTEQVVRGSGLRRSTQRPGPQAPRPGELFDIKQVGDACGLPHPVIAQLVRRTWTEAGWMYTAAQLRAAIDVAARLRSTSAAEPSLPQGDPLRVLVCSRCGALAADTDAECWLSTRSSGTADGSGCDYCPDCVIACAACPSVRGQQCLPAVQRRGLGAAPVSATAN